MCDDDDLAVFGFFARLIWNPDIVNEPGVQRHDIREARMCVIPSDNTGTLSFQYADNGAFEPFLLFLRRAAAAPAAIFRGGYFLRMIFARTGLRAGHPPCSAAG